MDTKSKILIISFIVLIGLSFWLVNNFDDPLEPIGAITMLLSQAIPIILVFKAFNSSKETFPREIYLLYSLICPISFISKFRWPISHIFLLITIFLILLFLLYIRVKKIRISDRVLINLWYYLSALFLCFYWLNNLGFPGYEFPAILIKSLFGLFSLSGIYLLFSSKYSDEHKFISSITLTYVATSTIHIMHLIN